MTRSALSDLADRIRASPCFSRKALQIATLNEVIRRFTDLPADTPKARRAVGTLLAVAQDWLPDLPDNPAGQRALAHLELAGKAACEAYGWVPVLDEQLAPETHQCADLR